MEQKKDTQLPAEVVHRILKCRDALVVSDRDEAYHQIYAIASPNFDKYFPWDEMEKQINYPKFNEEEIKANREVTEYASKLNLASQLLFRLASLVNAEQKPDEGFLTEIKTFLDGTK